MTDLPLRYRGFDECEGIGLRRHYTDLLEELATPQDFYDEVESFQLWRRLERNAIRPWSREKVSRKEKRDKQYQTQASRSHHYVTISSESIPDHWSTAVVMAHSLARGAISPAPTNRKGECAMSNAM